MRDLKDCSGIQEPTEGRLLVGAVGVAELRHSGTQRVNRMSSEVTKSVVHNRLAAEHVSAAVAVVRR